MEQRDGPASVGHSEPVVSRTRPVDVPPAVVLRIGRGPRVAWRSPDGERVVGCGATAVVAADGPDRLGTVRRRGSALLDAVEWNGPPPTRPRLLGGFSFHADHEPVAPWRGFPPAYFVLPRVRATRADGQTWLTATAATPDADPATVEDALDDAVETVRAVDVADRDPPGVARTERTPTRADWRTQVRAAVDRIDAGELEKVVLAASLAADLRGEFDLASALERLSTTYPDCFRFAVDPGDGAAFFGATPERLVRRRGERVRTEALAGSVGRGDTADEDERLADALRESGKVQHEHALVADAVRSRLTPFADSVTAADQAIRRLDTVQHLKTPITARLSEPTHVLALVDALHPTPAVGGLPPAAAARTIRETEAFDRGWYAAPVGWFDADGDGEFAVGIRSAVAGGRRATLFAGNGIVADSDPAAEWEELQLKYRPVLDHLR